MATAKKLPSGSYSVKAYIGKGENGKPRYKRFTAATKKEAELKAAQYKAEDTEKMGADITLKEAAERYIESKRNVVSPSTVRGYKVILRNYVPELFALYISDINQEKIQLAINKLAATKSPKTCRNVNGLISATLSAYRPEMIIKTTLPPKSHTGIYVPDDEEIEEIHRLAAGTVNEIPVFLAAECGLRASEISALRTDNVTADSILIREAAVLDENNKVRIKPPKSWSGYREIPISAKAVEYLLAHAVDGYICPRRAAAISNSWSEFRTKHRLNPRLNFHALRHHYASKCLLLGMPQKYIAELMGHSDTTMIEKVYQHIFPSAMERFAKKLRRKMDKSLIYSTKYSTTK